jgi:hypothetical protein
MTAHEQDAAGDDARLARLRAACTQHGDVILHAMLGSLAAQVDDAQWDLSLQIAVTQAQRAS